MQNSPRVKMGCKSWFIAGLFIIVQCLSSTSIAAELSTLFSTPEERQIINANRYKSDEVSPKPEKTVNPEQVKEPVVEQEVEEVAKTYRINGITVVYEGQHSVWINDEMYLDGEQLEGKVRVNVIVGKEIKVRLTGPDGKQYFGTSGESMEVKYLQATDS